MNYTPVFDVKFRISLKWISVSNQTVVVKSEFVSESFTCWHKTMEFAIANNSKHDTLLRSAVQLPSTRKTCVSYIEWLYPVNSCVSWLLVTSYFLAIFQQSIPKQSLLILFLFSIQAESEQHLITWKCCWIYHMYIQPIHIVQCPPMRVTMLSCHRHNESSYCGRKWWSGTNAFIIISIASVHWIELTYL